MKKEMGGIMESFIHLFNQHFLETSCVPDAFLGEGPELRNSPTRSSLMEFAFQRRGRHSISTQRKRREKMLSCH